MRKGIVVIVEGGCGDEEVMGIREMKGMNKG